MSKLTQSSLFRSGLGSGFAKTRIFFSLKSLKASLQLRTDCAFVLLIRAAKRANSVKANRTMINTDRRRLFIRLVSNQLDDHDSSESSSYSLPAALDQAILRGRGAHDRYVLHHARVSWNLSWAMWTNWTNINYSWSAWNTKTLLILAECKSLTPVSNGYEDLVSQFLFTGVVTELEHVEACRSLGNLSMTIHNDISFYAMSQCARRCRHPPYSIQALSTPETWLAHQDPTQKKC